jgi:glutamate-5-semialdehyde dehydrogenase
MDIKAFVLNKALEAKEGARALAKASSKQKNAALIGMAEALKKRSKDLISENKKDIKFTTREFKKEIDSIPDLNARQIEQKAYEVACSYLTGFRAKGLAGLVKAKLLR